VAPVSVEVPDAAVELSPAAPVVSFPEPPAAGRGLAAGGSMMLLQKQGQKQTSEQVLNPLITSIVHFGTMSIVAFTTLLVTFFIAEPAVSVAFFILLVALSNAVEFESVGAPFVWSDPVADDVEESSGATPDALKYHSP